MVLHNPGLPDVVQDSVPQPLHNPRCNDREQLNAIQLGQVLRGIARIFDMEINNLVHQPLPNQRLNYRAQLNAIQLGQELRGIRRIMERGQNRAAPFNQLAHDIFNELMIHVLGEVFFGLLRP